MGKNTQNYTENDTINKKAKIIYIHNINNFDYTFPLVRYGIEDNKCYIYAVQKNKKYDEENKLKIRRVFI